MESRPPKTYNIAEAKSRLSELVQRARMGEEVVIARDNKPVARLVPLVDRGQPRVPTDPVFRRYGIRRIWS